MKVWALVGLFTLASAPSAFALESLVDTPPEPADFMLSHVDPIGAPSSEALKLGAGKQSPTPAQNAQQQRQRTAEIDAAEQRRRRHEEPRRRRNGTMDRVPDSVLIGRRGAL
ncbi:MAG: hypothetical protein WDM79_12855 [Terricaulis sp.]